MITCNVYAYLGGAWTDITSDTLSSGALNYSGGIKGNKETDRIAGFGTLTFALKNNTGKYTPGSGTAHADWKKGMPIKVEFTRVTTKTKFIGRVNKIGLNYQYNNKTASITALSWLYFASQLPLDIPALQTDKRADEIINTILDFSPIAATAESIGTGVETFPYAFHDNTTKTTAYTEISKTVLSEWGYFYEKLDGTLVFEPYNGRASSQKQINVISDVTGFLLKEDGGYLLQENGDKIILEPYNVTTTDASATTINDSAFEYGEHIVNRVEVSVFPYRVGDQDVLVYKNEENQFVPNGATVSFRLQFTDQSSRLPIAAIAPAVKQYTLLHFDDNTDKGITGVLDDADLNTLRQAADGLYYPTTPFVSVGGNTTTGIFGDAFSGNGTTDYIYSPSQEKFNLRAGDLTIDYWEYRNSATAGAATLARDLTGGFSPFVLGYSDGAVARVYLTSNGSSWDIANAKSMGAITTGSWVHYALTKSGNTYRTFKNGVQQDTWTSSATILPSTASLGILRYGANYVNGIIDELRIIKGYAAWTADFTPPSKAYTMSGLNWSLHTGLLKTGTEITSSATATTSFGGAGLDFSITNSSGSDGYLTIDVYAQPLESLSPVSHIAEDTTSINAYGYFSERIDMRLRNDLVFPKTIAEAIVTDRKDPATVLNRISMVANKSDTNEALFMDCDMGDLVRVNDSLSGYNALNYIQGISWKASPGDDGVIVDFSWIVKEQ